LEIKPMKSSLFALIVLLTSAPLLEADDLSGDLQKSAGRWRLVAITDDGNEVPSASLRGLTITIVADVYTIRAGSRILERGTFVLDPSQTPKAIDATVTEGPGKGTKSVGIYSVNDTTRKVCFAAAGQPRPTKFDASKGTKQALFISRRESKDDAAKAELQLLQGEWQMESMERDGRKVNDRLVKTFKRTVAGNRHTVTWIEIGSNQILHATMSLDPTSDPKGVDLLLADGPFKGKTRLGIYKLEGDTETVCLAQPGRPRPTAFDSKQGAIHVWKRVKK
jgi:uncharacterized protein (TIGR03067 family)